MNQPDDTTPPKPPQPPIPPRVPPFRGPLGGSPGPLAGRPGAATPPRHPARPGGGRPVFATPPTSLPPLAAPRLRATPAIPAPPVATTTVAFPVIDDPASAPPAPSPAPAGSGQPLERTEAAAASTGSEGREPPQDMPFTAMKSEAPRSSYHDYAAFDPASWPDEPLTNAGADVLASQAPTAPLADVPSAAIESHRPGSAEFDTSVREHVRPGSTTPRESDVIGADATIASATGWDPAWDADEETPDGTGAGFAIEPLESSIDPGPDLERWDGPGHVPHVQSGSAEEAAWSSRAEPASGPRSGGADTAVAEALERVAARFRTGELGVPPGMSASPDEAALALALSVLLGRRR